LLNGRYPHTVVLDLQAPALKCLAAATGVRWLGTADGRRWQPKRRLEQRTPEPRWRHHRFGQRVLDLQRDAAIAHLTCHAGRNSYRDAARFERERRWQLDAQIAHDRCAV
jgi:hypothetical protein